MTKAEERCRESALLLRAGCIADAPRKIDRQRPPPSSRTRPAPRLLCKASFLKNFNDRSCNGADPPVIREQTRLYLLLSTKIDKGDKIDHGRHRKKIGIYRPSLRGLRFLGWHLGRQKRCVSGPQA